MKYEQLEPLKMDIKNLNAVQYNGESAPVKDVITDPFKRFQALARVRAITEEQVRGSGQYHDEDEITIQVNKQMKRPMEAAIILQSASDTSLPEALRQQAKGLVAKAEEELASIFITVLRPREELTRYTLLHEIETVIYDANE